MGTSLAKSILVNLFEMKLCYQITMTVRFIVIFFNVIENQSVNTKVIKT